MSYKGAQLPQMLPTPPTPPPPALLQMQLNRLPAPSNDSPAANFTGGPFRAALGNAEWYYNALKRDLAEEGRKRKIAQVNAENTERDAKLLRVENAHLQAELKKKMDGTKNVIELRAQLEKLNNEKEEWQQKYASVVKQRDFLLKDNREINNLTKKLKETEKKLEEDGALLLQLSAEKTKLESELEKAKEDNLSMAYAITDHPSSSQKKGDEQIETLAELNKWIGKQHEQTLAILKNFQEKIDAEKKKNMNKKK